MQASIIHVEGMACEHCVKAVTTALIALSGVEAVSVDLDAGTATVEHDPALAPLDMLKAAIEDQGYDVVE